MAIKGHRGESKKDAIPKVNHTRKEAKGIQVGVTKRNSGGESPRIKVLTLKHPNSSGAVLQENFVVGQYGPKKKGWARLNEKNVPIVSKEKSSEKTRMQGIV